MDVIVINDICIGFMGSYEHDECLKTVIYTPGEDEILGKFFSPDGARLFFLQSGFMVTPDKQIMSVCGTQIGRIVEVSDEKT